LKKPFKYFTLPTAFVLSGAIILSSMASGNLSDFLEMPAAPRDTIKPGIEDTSSTQVKLPFPFKDHDENPAVQTETTSPLFLKDPSNIKDEVEYIPEFNEYVVSKRMGNIDYRIPNTMSMEEYKKYQFKKSMHDYWREKTTGKSTTDQSFIPKINLGGEAFDKIFGTNVINIVPQGSAELIFGLKTSRVDNPNIPENLRKITTFDFQQKIIMNVNGSIGDKVKLGFNYNTEANFSFENKTKLEYTGKEDEIVKKVEAGNVSLPLSGTLINGSQSLFGLKTELQFGKLNVTTVLSQQKGQSSVIETKGGAQTNKFEIPVDQYEANKHFFLAQYFRDTYEEAVKDPSVIVSDATITKIEVWITNKTASYTNTRNIIGFVDLGENNPDIISIPAGSRPELCQVHNEVHYPSNEANTLYKVITDTAPGNPYNVRNFNNLSAIMGNLSNKQVYSGKHYEKIQNARLLLPSEYDYNPRLGIISLNSALNSDEVLAVAYQFSARGGNYQVGDLTSDGINPNRTLVLKLIKGTTLTPRFKPTWNLMMKNVYSLGAYQVSAKDFKLDIMYMDDSKGRNINYFPAGDAKDKIILKSLGLDRVNSQGDPYPDGVFDFVEGVRIKASNGRIYLPYLEPFGNTIRKILDTSNVHYNTIEKYVYQELYDSSQTKARLISWKNKFKLVGSYQSSSSSEIVLNAMQIPQGSVKVTANGTLLQENIDYMVDYTLGRVKIINPGLISSGTPIQVSLENNALFSLQTKTLLGTHLDYKFNEDFNLGATLLHLNERPLTQKVNYGDDPISNTIWGLNGSYRTQSQLLTTLIDKLPFLETKEPSTITLDGEFAQLIPGHSSAIKEGGVTYIDDFEGSETSYDIKTFSAWKLASTPQGQTMFPEGDLSNDLRYGFNRAQLAWYNIDPLFFSRSNENPDFIRSNTIQQQNPYVADIYENQLWPNKQFQNNIPPRVSVFNMAFYPDERGPYNYVVNGVAGYSGIDKNTGKLLDPDTRWGGIMRSVPVIDFEAANIQFIEFWVMDPFLYDSTNTGKLYFNLGNISEDILRDSRKSFENGLPANGDTSKLDNTVWGKVSQDQSITNAFNTDPATRTLQDVGLDGLNDTQEAEKFSSFLTDIKNLNPVLYDEVKKDPSSDDFYYYKDARYDTSGILERYKLYNGMENNSPVATGAYMNTNSTLPDMEDINNDNTMSESESYYQYEVNLSRKNMTVGQNFIIDSISTNMNVGNSKMNVKWYQFRIPIAQYENVIGSIDGFQSIRFMRMFLKGFKRPVVLRFAKLDLVRGEWREYELPLDPVKPSTTAQEDIDGTLTISSVNIEENNGKSPIPYVLAPGVDRVIDPMNQTLRMLNEQSMVLKVNNLRDGDAKAAYKTTKLDMRQYKRIQMYIHGEQIEGHPLYDHDLSIFLRIGSDANSNYYEYEVPVKLSPWGKSDPYLVWPVENNMNIDLSVLLNAKIARNNQKAAITVPFVYTDGKNIVRVVGNPNLSDIRAIMIGVKNPADAGGLAKFGEFWVNELRLTDVKDKGGWAGNAHATVKLADWGTLSVAGFISTPGWGSLESKTNERSKETVDQIDISTNLEMGKFFPEKAKVSIPTYLGYSKSVSTPEYDPLNPDILLQDVLDNAKNKHERDSIKSLSQSIIERKSINFTNVKVNRANKKPKIWDPANFSTTFSYNSTFSKDINTEYNYFKNYIFSFSYLYNTKPKNITPFAKIKLFNAPALRLIKDFNFNYYPSKVSFRTDLNRTYNEIKLRNLTNPDLKIDSTVTKDFLWNRYYDMRFDLTKSITLDYSAAVNARIDEPQGAIDNNGYMYSNGNRISWRDTVFSFLKQNPGGRIVQYRQDISVNYTLPINKIPLLNWVTSSIRYGGSYGWDAGKLLYPIGSTPLPNEKPTNLLGNTIKNSQTLQVNGQLNMTSLYNKIDFLKKINQYKKPPKNQKPTKKVTFEKDSLDLKKGVRKIIFHKLQTSEITVKFTDVGGKEIKGKLEITNENKIAFTPESDSKSAKVKIEGTIEIKENPIIIVLRNTAKILMGIKSINVAYSETAGILLPGYKPGVSLFGSQDINTPGVDFILGAQPTDSRILNRAKNGNWLTTDPSFNSPFNKAKTTNLTFRANIEPIPGLRIDLTSNQTKSTNLSATFKPDSIDKSIWVKQNAVESGNYSMTFIAFKSMFEKIDYKFYHSPAFEKFKDNRYIIQGRLNDSTKTGNGLTSQQVLIPAFLSAYGYKMGAQRIFLTPMPEMLSTFPIPNWNITYDGLSKLEIIQQYLQTITLKHSYRCTYNVGTYTSNPNYIDERHKVANVNGDYEQKYSIGSVSIVEMFSPLISIDVTWKNNLMNDIEFKKSRNLTLSMANSQLTEVDSWELALGCGYRIKDLHVIVNQKLYKSDLILNADLSIRNDITISRPLDQEAQVVQGKKTIGFKFSADYALSDKFNLRFFYDRTNNNPYISNGGFPTMNSNIGFSAKFTLSQ
jgi:cell surface protein SprA